MRIDPIWSLIVLCGALWVGVFTTVLLDAGVDRYYAFGIPAVLVSLTVVRLWGRRSTENGQ
jgi:hypothetical protein